MLPAFLARLRQRRLRHRGTGPRFRQRRSAWRVWAFIRSITRRIRQDSISLMIAARASIRFGSPANLCGFCFDPAPGGSARCFSSRTGTCSTRASRIAILRLSGDVWLTRRSISACTKWIRDHSVIGGSTLATQLEKLRHSPEGRTHSPAEKLRQIASATLRSYQDGPRNSRRPASVSSAITSIRFRFQPLRATAR